MAPADIARLRAEEDVKNHIYHIHDKSWSVKELRVVSRVKDGETLLDLGCCLGRDLRKPTLDAETSTSLFGVDLERKFSQLGFELFRLEHIARTFGSGRCLRKLYLVQAWQDEIDIVEWKSGRRS